MRCLLNIYLPVYILVAVFIVEINKRLKGAGAAILVFMLAVHMAGTLRLSTNDVILPQGIFPYEKKLISFCRENDVNEAFTNLTVDHAMRLAYYTEGEIVFMSTEGLFHRIESFMNRFRESQSFTLIFSEDLQVGKRPDRSPDDPAYHEAEATRRGAGEGTQERVQRVQAIQGQIRQAGTPPQSGGN